jgi:hypothetical protein
MPRITGGGGPRIPRPQTDAADASAPAGASTIAPAADGTPAEPVTQPRPPALASPSHEIGSRWNGYSWDPKVFDEVMKRFAVGDAMGLVQTAAALDMGDRYLSRDELVEAARKKVAYVTHGYRWSPGVLADVMQKKGVAEETALLRAAKKVDDGDRVFDRAELERAADVLNGVVAENDPKAIADRVRALASRPDLSVDELGEVNGYPVLAARFPCTGPEVKLRVVVTGGVHGNEPCGAGAAMLLIEQLAANPKLREDMEFIVVPTVNPTSLKANNRRTLGADVDLNREFDNDDMSPEEVVLLQDYLRNKKYDLGLDLHSGYAKRDGFWVYSKGAGADDLMSKAFDRFEQEWPILHNKPSPIRPGVLPSSGNGGTLKDWFVDHGGARWAATVEAPGSLSYKDMLLGENELAHDIIEQARARVYAEDAAAANGNA